MKETIKRIMILGSVACILALAVYGCGNIEKTSTEFTETGIETSISGKISKLGEMQFDMKADNKVVKEDGTIESKGNGHKLTVLYDEETTFYIRTIYGDGSSYEDEEAAAEDMAKDMRVEITGCYEGKKFHAAQVQIMKFE